MKYRNLTLLFSIVCPFLYLLGCSGNGSWNPNTMGAGRGVPWTILCIEVPGPYRVKNSEALAARLKTVKGISSRQVRVSHDPDQVSRIYYGKYTVKRNPGTQRLEFPEKIDDDVKLIKSLQATDGKFHFIFARRLRWPVPDVGNPQWDLRKNPGDCTLQFAVFEADVVANFKDAAAKWCESLRKDGYEAWYYHTDSMSTVTVGSFPRTEVVRRGAMADYGPQIQSVLNSNEIFQTNWTNGNRLIVHKDGAKSPVPSTVVFIPGKEDLFEETARFMDRILIATTNAGKVEEIRQLLAGIGVRVVSLDDYPNVIPPAETGRTFEDNAKLKALYYAQQTGCFTLADDSGLVVDMLGGAPGVRSSRYASEYATDTENNARLLQDLKDVPAKQRSARFVCVAALASPDSVITTTRGTLEGFILERPRGTGGFGYDPLFYIPDLEKALAEIDSIEKNRISHRGQAIRSIVPRIKRLFQR